MTSDWKEERNNSILFPCNIHEYLMLTLLVFVCECIAYNAQTNILSVRTSHKYPLDLENSENLMKYRLKFLALLSSHSNYAF